MYLYELLTVCQANYLAIVGKSALRPCWEGSYCDENGKARSYLDVVPADLRYARVVGFSEYYDPKHGGATMIEVKL